MKKAVILAIFMCLITAQATQAFEKGYETDLDSFGSDVSENLMGFQDCFNEIRDTVSLDYLAEILRCRLPN